MVINLLVAYLGQENFFRYTRGVILCNKLQPGSWELLGTSSIATGVRKRDCRNLCPRISLSVILDSSLPSLWWYFICLTLHCHCPQVKNIFFSYNFWSLSSDSSLYPQGCSQSNDGTSASTLSEIQHSLIESLFLLQLIRYHVDEKILHKSFL